eukprot:gene34556-39065_t
MEDKSGLTEHEWDLEFHGVDYVINVMVSDRMLTIELENAETSERWSA